MGLSTGCKVLTSRLPDLFLKPQLVGAGKRWYVLRSEENCAERLWLLCRKLKIDGVGYGLRSHWRDKSVTPTRPPGQAMSRGRGREATREELNV